MRKYYGIILVAALGLLAACSGNETVAVMIQTELGDITLELYPDKAPITVANFLRYVDEGGLPVRGPRPLATARGLASITLRMLNTILFQHDFCRGMGGRSEFQTVS